MEKMRVNKEIDSLKKDPDISDVNFTDNKLTLDFEDPVYGIIKYSIEIPQDYPIKAPIASYKRPRQTTYTIVDVKDWTPVRLLGGIIKTAHKTKMEPFDIEGGKRRRKTRRRTRKSKKSKKSRRYRR
jgi:ubiquitin-protein ligase